MPAAPSPRPAGARVLVLADRVPRPGLRVGEHRLLQLLAELACLAPRPAITLLVADWCAGAGREDVVSTLGVEVVSHAPDWAAWFAAQQLDLVVVHGAVAQRRFGAPLDTSHPETPRIVDASALASLDRAGPTAPLDGDDEGRGLTVDAARARDLGVVGPARLVLCTSDHEASLVHALAPDVSTTVLRTHVTPRRLRLPRSLRRGITMVGSFVDGPGSPDEDAALFLAREVLPIVRSRRDVELTVVGEDATHAVRSLTEGSRFQVARGAVGPMLDAVLGVVVVRRFGRATSAGLCAAVEAGTPVLTAGAAGPWNDAPDPLRVADTPESLAAAIVALADDGRVWESAARATAEWAATMHHDRYRERLVDALARVGLEVVGREAPRRIAWQGRTHGRWLPDAAARVAPAVPPLDLAVADQVTTAGVPEPEAPQDFAIEPLYDEWIRQRDPTPRQRWSREERAASLPFRPVVSIVLVSHDLDPALLRTTLTSLQAQAYTRWELCIVDDGSMRLDTLGALTDAAARETRVRLLRLDDALGRAGAANAGLARSRGDLVSFVRGGGVLEPLALLEVVALWNQCPELDVIYTDEHEYDAGTGRLRHPALKPSWSRDLLRSTNYVGQLTVFRRSLVVELGGLRDGFDGALDYDLVLRATDASDRVGHVALPLYRTNLAHDLHTDADLLGPPPDVSVVDAGRRALAESIDRSGEPGVVEDSNHRGDYRVRYAVTDHPLVGIVIPTRDRHDLVDTAVSSIHERSTYQHVEITIVDNASTDPDTLEYLDRHDGPVLRYPAPFNYARMMNMATDASHADLVLFLNNDVEVFQPDWIEAMLEHAQRASVGAVGARLWYPAGIPQHQGIFVGGSGRAHNADFARSFIAGDDRHMIMQRGRTVANFAAVTGACLMARPSVLAEVGGFEERLHVAFNDVDLCLKMRARGYDIVATPFASLVHYESATRGSTHPTENDDWFGARWGIGDDYQDPYSNPNYDQRRRFALRLPA